MKESWLLLIKLLETNCFIELKQLITISKKYKIK